MLHLILAAFRWQTTNSIIRITEKLLEILLDSGAGPLYLLPPSQAICTNTNHLFPMATKEVILREKINKLGSEADVVTVKAGFANNYLIPEGKAYEANKGNLKHLESLNAKRVQREAEELENAKELAGKINKLKLSFTLESGQGGKAFGSITTIDIHKELSEKGVEVDRHAIQLDGPIKTSGKQDLEIKLHPEISATVKIDVKVSGDSQPEDKQAAPSE